MALIKCHECGNEISDAAKSCPQCGAKPKKKVGLLGITFVLLVGFVVFKCTTAVDSAGTRTAEREAAKTPEQRAAESAARAAEEKRITAALKTKRLVIEHAKNPTSLQFAQLRISEDGELICGTYRATNSYNAVVPGVVAVTKQGYAFDAGNWEKSCSKATGLYDMGSVVK